MSCRVEVVHGGGDRPRDGRLLVGSIAAHQNPAFRIMGSNPTLSAM
jgi:hypothetical protein